MSNVFTVAFFGHRYIENVLVTEKNLEDYIYQLIKEKEYVVFLVGRNGEFDQSAASSIIRVRKRFRDDNSSLVLVLPYYTSEYLNNQEYFHDYYSEVEVSNAASSVHPKMAIQIRNREMVDRADLILCYVERKEGGAWKTVQYAVRQGKKVINLATETNKA